MQRRLITVILFALLAALASSTVLYRIISAKSARASDSGASQVYVAARDIVSGSIVGDADIRAVKWLGSVSSQWATRREDIVGRALTAAINNGEPFAGNRLAEKGAGAGFAARIPQGMRVVPVHVDEAGGLSRLITAGMHVDVLSTGAPAGQSGVNATTHTILQNVIVFSTDQSVERDAQEKPAATQSVILLVSPEQAEALSQAITQTHIQLVLRNPLDKSSVAEASGKPVKTPMFFSHPLRPAPVEPRRIAAAAAGPAPEARPTIEIVQGSKRTVTAVSVASSQESTQ